MIGGVFAIITYAYGQFTKGKIESKFDTINLLKEQVDALEKALAFSDGKKKVEIDALNSKIDLLTREIQDLHVAIDSKDKKQEELLAIIQGKDPQMLEFIKLFTVDVLPTIKRMDQFLNKQKF